MTVLLGKSRLAEIEQVQRALRTELKLLTIKHSANLSWIETYAAIIRAVEEMALGPAEEIRDRASAITARWSGNAEGHAP